MRPHPYLRAYMAGIVVPTVFLLVVVTVFAMFLAVLPPVDVQPGAENGAVLGTLLQLASMGRALIFPMAVVPNLWGVWNMLYLTVRRRTTLPLGLHGALLPVLLVPSGMTLARAFGVFRIEAALLVPFAAIVMIVYYLVWKHIVGFLNREMGIG